MAIASCTMTQCHNLINPCTNVAGITITCVHVLEGTLTLVLHEPLPASVMTADSYPWSVVTLRYDRHTVFPPTSPHPSYSSSSNQSQIITDSCSAHPTPFGQVGTRRGALPPYPSFQPAKAAAGTVDVVPHVWRNTLLSVFSSVSLPVIAKA